MKTSQFDYQLPENLIAQTPLESRDSSKLLVINPNTASWMDATFADLSKILTETVGEDKKTAPLIVVNRSRVLPARVRVRRKTGARGEVFLLEPGKSATETHSCLLRPQKKLKIGETLFDDLRGDTPLFKVDSLSPPRVSTCNLPLRALLDAFGEMPLPPYIDRDPNRVGNNFNDLDKERYQTVYATEAGSVASSTAGLHFTERMIAQCEDVGCEFTPVTLHIGLGTFLPVTAETIEDHTMHREAFSVSADTINKLCQAIAAERPIVFVGTTSLRSIESLLRQAFPDHNSHGGNLRRHVANEAKAGTLEASLKRLADTWLETDLFVRPRNQDDIFLPACGQALLTNFHQPMSTLVMLVASLLGYNYWKMSYEHAVKQRYRFLSYGDSSLILFKSGDQP